MNTRDYPTTDALAEYVAQRFPGLAVTGERTGPGTGRVTVHEPGGEAVLAVETVVHESPETGTGAARHDLTCVRLGSMLHWRLGGGVPGSPEPEVREGRLVDGRLFCAALSELGLTVMAAGDLIDLDRRNCQRVAKGERGLSPDKWAALAAAVESKAETAETEASRWRKRAVAGRVRGVLEAYGDEAREVETMVQTKAEAVTGARVIARVPLVGADEDATVERRPDGSYGWRIGGQGELQTRQETAEDACAQLAPLIEGGCWPKAGGIDLDRMLLACIRHDSDEGGRGGD